MNTTREANSIPDDADPMIDALLAEFVPTDPGERKTPPDLTQQILGKLLRRDDAEMFVGSADPCASDPAEESLVEDADPMIDVLLAEFVPSNVEDRKTPPDLTAQILQKLGQRENVEPVVAPKVAVMTNAPTPMTRPHVATRAILLVLTVAASVIGLVWMSRPTINGPDDTEVASAETSSVRSPLPEGEKLVESAPIETDLETRVLPRELSPSSADVLANRPPESPSSVDIEPSTDRGLRPEALTTVAKSVEALSQRYWESLGVTPTPEAPNHEVVSRLKSRLGVALSADSLRDVNRLRRQLAKGANEVTLRWLAGASARSVNAVAENETLVKAVSAGFNGKASFDETLVSLIDGSNEHSSDWYRTLGGFNSEIIAVRLADLSMDADLRCVRCHDSMIGGDLTQDNYWSFVALLRSALKRDSDRWAVDNEKETKPVFFDLPDGRARMAEPRVDFLSRDDSPTRFDDWSRSLIGSEALADGLVDSLWKLVYGRKLSASAFDAVAAPVDPTLVELHDQLSADLQRSGFDMARTLALIVSSPMARRSVPDSLRKENALTASKESREQALELVGAFAATTESPRSTRTERIDLAMRRIGKRFGESPSGMLAQPILSNKNPKASRSESGTNMQQRFRDLLGVDFPRDDASLPVSWLRSIEDYDEQVRHLVYLSGRGGGNNLIKVAAEQLEEASSRESALSRLWWILSE